MQTKNSPVREVFRVGDISGIIFGHRVVDEHRQVADELDTVLSMLLEKHEYIEFYVGKNGEFAEKYLHQGTKIIVEGRWQTGSYTNKDGQKVYTNDCVVERHEFCESKSQSNSQPQPTQSNDNLFMSIPDNLEDEGLPFN